ncbi:hypothetical protein KKI90_04450 [Xenorhabdus bovienii]|uniref:hypothetical protein n=2 Tax=Xenorhabdus bovienii TaxID=40576 RepID=UPI00237CDCD6|nr:hypothetical protein [Xenorhabdus bovienii]MDE1485657.1 hypothetical protein [Xenorhabdus bovienii]MDE9476360.1 hypothetical protein [Xenorhabdus bovienii]MDE9529251.1 hypothetical protein [Xenorhabdus bovienii]
MSNSRIIIILKSLIHNLEKKESKQGIDLYKNALDFFSKNDLSNEELFNLYRSFCGYLAHGEFTQLEYDSILEIIEILDKSINQ